MTRPAEIKIPDSSNSRRMNGQLAHFPAHRLTARYRASRKPTPLAAQRSNKFPGDPPADAVVMVD